MSNSTIEQELDRQGHCFFQTVGDSMEPLLHNRKSTVVIEKSKGALRKYDVALYRRPTGEYVLHRVAKVKKGSYLICGDNRIYREPVPEGWILGVMVGFYPDEGGRYISCAIPEYQEYIRMWGIRYWRRWGKALPGRIHRKLKGKNESRRETARKAHQMHGKQR